MSSPWNMKVYIHAELRDGTVIHYFIPGGYKDSVLGWLNSIPVVTRVWMDKT